MVVGGGMNTYMNDETSYIAQVKGEFWKFSPSFFIELTYQFSWSREYNVDWMAQILGQSSRLSLRSQPCGLGHIA